MHLRFTILLCDSAVCLFYCGVVFHYMDVPQFLTLTNWRIFQLFALNIGLCVDIMFSFSWYKLLYVILLGYMTGASSFYKIFPTCFLHWLYNFWFPPVMHESSGCSVSLTALDIVSFLAILVDTWWYLILILVCISQMINKIVHICYLYIFFHECLPFEPPFLLISIFCRGTINIAGWVIFFDLLMCSYIWVLFLYIHSSSCGVDGHQCWHW